MMKWEERLRGWLSRNILWLGFGAVALLGLYLRYAYLPNLAADLEFMNSSWYEAIQRGGMAAALDPELQYTYSPLHLYLWALAAKLLGGLDTHTALKLVSLLAEALTAPVFLMLLSRLLPREQKKPGLFIGFALFWLSPVMLWNVAGWGQTDILYALFSLLSVWLLLRDRPEWGLAALGVALAWKLQAVFLLPLYIIAYFCGQKRFSLLWFLAVPGVLVLSGLPMALIGESPLFAVNVYLGQTSLYQEITYNCPNLFALMGDALNNSQAVLGLFSRTGMALCVAALGVMAVRLIGGRATLNARATVLLGAWCVLCCVFLLPRMHERYGLVGEMLLWCWAAAEGKPRGYLYALAAMAATLSAYAQYMFRYPFFSLQLGGLINLAVLCCLTWEVVKACQPAKAEAMAV